MLFTSGVVVIPGDAFGNGAGYVRIALVQEEDRLREAADRLSQFLKTAVHKQ
jgi:LL-diaminopimelate aminotransferase